MLEIDAVRESGAFHRVIEVARGQLVFLQLTPQPTEDLDADVENRYITARRAIAPILMDVVDVDLRPLDA